MYPKKNEGETVVIDIQRFINAEGWRYVQSDMIVDPDTKRGVVSLRDVDKNGAMDLTG